MGETCIVKSVPSTRRVPLLTPDELGRLGEDSFRKMCSQARLLAHAPSADRWGWDFMVEESGAEVEDDGDLAARRVPPQRMVQVKAVREGAREVSLRLSSAERLGKSPNPSFLCILEISEEREPVRMHILHMHGPLLERVLRRLREMQADGRSTHINRVKFQVPLPKAIAALAPTGAALRQAMDEAIGPDADAYMQTKASFLKEAGFPERRIGGTFTVRTKSEDDLPEFLLGQRPLEVVDFEAVETRWDIAIPLVPSGQPLTVKAVPVPKDVEVVWRRAGALSPVRLRMQAVVAAHPSGDPARDRMVITHPNLTLRIVGPKLDMTVRGPDTVSMSYRDLMQFHAFEKVLASGGPIDIQLLYRGRNLISWRTDDAMAIRPEENVVALGRVLDELGKVLGVADIADVMMPTGSWKRWREQLRSIHAMLIDPSAVTGSLTVEVPESLKKDFDEREALYVSALHFGDGILAYYAIARARLASCEDARKRRLKFRDFDIRELRLIERSSEAMEAFATEATAITGLTTSLVLWGEAAEGLTPIQDEDTPAVEA